jgi:hypothetical protein
MPGSKFHSITVGYLALKRQSNSEIKYKTFSPNSFFYGERKLTTSNPLAGRSHVAGCPRLLI